MHFLINSVEYFAVWAIIIFGIFLALVTLIDMSIRIIIKKLPDKTEDNPNDQNSDDSTNKTPLKDKSVDKKHRPHRANPKNISEK